MTAAVTIDRTLHLLAVVQGDKVIRRIEPMLRGIGATSLVTERVGGEHITFAHRLADAVILVGLDDALATLAYLRLADVDLPIVVFRPGTADACDEALMAGAAACAPMPRSASELTAVVRAALSAARRRATARHTPALDPVGLTVRWRHATAKLTQREFALLQCLVTRADTPVSIARLQAHAWGETLPAQSASQIVTVYIHQIRRKLRGLGLHDAIETVRNFGYVFVAPAGRAARAPHSPRGPGASRAPAAGRGSASVSRGASAGPRSRSSPADRPGRRFRPPRGHRSRARRK